jgi:DNA-binding NtrC family response regulator
MSVDLGAITESLFESELFGHKKGAFTDAKKDRTGRIQAAHGGTLFLDEIGNLPLHLQAKLLSVLEQRLVSPVGSTKPEEIDIRIISATNLPKKQLNDGDIFRQDLLFRLNTVEIGLPPLRDRADDIPAIALYYAELYGKKYGHEPKAFSAAAMEVMANYHWPGNIRALRHSIERAVILSESDQFEPWDFQISNDSIQPARIQPSGEASGEGADEFNLEKLEKRTITQALGRNRYNISHTAKDLGLTRAALYRRMEKHGL